MSHNSRFTPENRAAFVTRVEVGQSLKDAAEASGLKLPTVRGWLARGRRETEGEYTDFANAVAEAQEGQRLEALTEEEHRAKVSEVARRGNVQALKLYWEMIVADRKSTETEEEDQADPLAEVDELSQRRAART